MSDEMTITQAQIEKSNLERSIGLLIRAFEEKTGARVKGIVVNRRSVETVMGEPLNYAMEVSVHAEL